MIIFNHQAFPKKIGGFSVSGAIFLSRKAGYFCAPAFPTGTCFAGLSRKITPNKPEQKSVRNPRALHRGMTGLSGRSSIFDKAEFVAVEQPQKGVVMIKALCIVGTVILVGLVGAGLVAWLMTRAQKEIDSWKIDPDRL